MIYNKNIVLLISFVILYSSLSNVRAAPICNCGSTAYGGNEAACCWEFDEATGKLTISSGINSSTGKPYENVVMKNYACEDSTGIGDRPWEENIAKIKNIVIENNITNIGRNSFQNAYELLTVTGMKNVKSIGMDCFVGTPKLQIIETPSVEVLENYSLMTNSPYLTSIDLPKIKSIGLYALSRNLEFLGLPNSNVNMDNAIRDDAVLKNCSNTNRASCGSCGDEYIMSGLGCVDDCGSGYLIKDSRCISETQGCGDYRRVGNRCNRIRYTPAEAAAIATTDHNTFVLYYR